MAITPRLDFSALKALFDDTTLPNAVNTRARIDEIAARLMFLLSGDGGVAPPDSPENFSAVGGTLSAVCTWDAAARAVRYNIWRSASGSSTASQVGSTTATTFTDIGVAAGTYVYYVVAENLDGDLSAPSDSSDATVSDGAAGIPTTPTGFGAAVSGDGNVTPFQVDISWNALAGGTETVRIERALGASGTNWQTILEGVAGTSAVDNAVQQNLTYRYRAYGVGSGGGESAATAIVNVTIPSSDTVPPPVPQNFSVAAGDEQIVLTWDASTADDLDVYQYDMRTASGVPNLVRNTTETKIIVTGLTNGTPFWFVVRAVDTAGNASAYTSELTATPQSGGVDTTPPVAPKGLVGTSTSPTNITLNWTANAEDDLSTYTLYRSSPPSGSGAGPFDGGTSIPGSLTTAAVNGLTVPGVYYFRLTATDVSGNESSPSNTVAVELGSTPGGDTGVEPDPTATGDDFGNSSSTGITAQYTEGSTVHGYAGNSAAQNAALFIPGMRAARTGRAEGTTRNTNVCANDGILTTVVDDEIIRLEWRDAWNNFVCGLNVYDDIHVIDNCRFEMYPPPYVDPFAKWLLRRYNMPGMFTTDVDYVGLFYKPNSNDPSWALYSELQEHADYSNTSGPVAVLNSTCTDFNGHFYYVTNRPYTGGDNYAATRSNLYLMQNCHAHNTDMGGSRPSSAVEIFDYGHPTHQSTVIVRNSTFVQNFPFKAKDDVSFRGDPNSPIGAGEYRARGVFNFTQFVYAGNPVGASDIVYDPDTDDPICSLLLWQNNLVDVTDANDRSSIQISGVDDVRFENSVFINRGGTRGEIIINKDHNDGYDSRHCNTLTVRNCKREGGFRLLIQLADGSTADVSYALDSENFEYVFNALTGALTSSQAIDPTTASTNPAPIINAIDPYAAVTVPAGYTMDWGITGVTV